MNPDQLRREQQFWAVPNPGAAMTAQALDELMRRNAQQQVLRHRGEPIQPFGMDLVDDNVEFDDEERDLISPDELKETLKKRHLNRMERDALHKPKTDWFETPAGEVCKNAETLVVSDIINKFVKK
jgi:hypothetical protein